MTDHIRSTARRLVEAGHDPKQVGTVAGALGAAVDKATPPMTAHELAKLFPDELRAKTFEAVASTRRGASPFWR